MRNGEVRAMRVDLCFDLFKIEIVELESLSEILLEKELKVVRMWVRIENNVVFFIKSLKEQSRLSAQ